MAHEQSLRRCAARDRLAARQALVEVQRPPQLDLGLVQRVRGTRRVSGQRVEVEVGLLPQRIAIGEGEKARRPALTREEKLKAREMRREEKPKNK